MNKSKKLLYITRYSLSEDFNLKKKFDGQLNAFKNLGFDVYFIGYDKEHFYLVNGEKKTVIGKSRFFIPMYINTFFYMDINKLAEKVVKENDFDYVYWRLAPLFKSSCKLAKAINSVKAKLILEIPTYPSNKESVKGVLRKLFVWYSRRYNKPFNECVDFYSLIGEDAHGEYLGKVAINIENGIDVSSVPMRTPVNEKDTVNILALASMSYWHGYDRLIRSLYEYKGDTKVIIHMVGGNDGGCLEEWKALTNELGLQDKVIFYGKMSGEPLEKMFNLCDIGVNSLAMYKKNFSMTAELKAREYVSRGLPFVCSVDDPALKGCDKVMWHRVSNNSSIPDMSEIVEFALKMKNDATHTESLRKLAENRMTWEMQYKRLFEIIGGTGV